MRIARHYFHFVINFFFAGLVNRGDSFRRRHSRSNSVFPNSTSNADRHQKEMLERLAKESASNVESTAVTYDVSVIGATGVGKTSLISQFMTSECINPYDRERGEYYTYE